MHFFDSGWCNFGTKRSLVDSLSAITRINSSLLQGRTPLSGFSVAQRFSWAASRQTSRTEDIAYCLFGIFELNLPLLYGEGKNAFRRLQEEIIRTILDLSIFAWQVLPLDQDDNPMSKADFDHVFVPRTGDVVLSGIFAESPAEFYPCVDYVSFPEDVLGEVSNSSKGIKIHSRLLLCAKLGFQEWDYVLPLRCKSHNRWLGIHLRQVGYQVYLRAEPRLLLQYYDRAFSTGELSTIQPQERHLLLRIPNASGYQDDRLVQSRKILSRVRSDVLHIRSPAQLSIIEPWPLANFDHQDRMFSFRNNSRHRFACAKIFGIVPHPDVTRRGTVAFSGWICAVHMQNNNTSFGIFASTLSNDRKINQVLDLLSKADYHTEQIMTLLDTCGIPMVSSAICPILGTPYVAEVTARSSETRDPSVCRNIYRQITLDYRITLGTKQLSILRKQKWIETERQMRPDAARLLVSSDSYWLPEQL
ncbi:hypothetical protein HBI56_205850 [Parastagonospora nodorum]|nr:hypothetical protein HBH53_073590 [Parastagonospora nodorum]KAH3965926.1 hypothetical protein HBH51_148170 [Parastagonospora nodorum]KAH3973897.1 hypothetical protein HBH52_138200 [Parastagonospora nodorum]KAH3998812.1 hypothetical protein HBI10_125180 [Parastagonospora nodorum]KAH4024210.1 hypothetical protein HBI13_084340 [Parastagonospora nodorum]